MQKLLLLLFTIQVGFVNGQGIEFFEGTWKEAMAKAKSEEKLMFVDAYAKWCGPCKVMAKNVFTQPKVGEYFNANFINLKLDMEEIDGVSFGHLYPVTAYPTLIFLDGEGKLIKKVIGGQQAEGLIAHGEDANRKNDKSGKFEEKYLAGDRSFDLMYDYIKALNAVNKPSLKISNDYLNTEPQISEKQKDIFILEAAIEADSKLFDYVLENKSRIISAAGQKEFEDKCKSACQTTINKAVEYEMESLLTETSQKAKKAFPDDADIFIAKANMQYQKAFRNEDKYISAYKALAKKSNNNVDDLKHIVQEISKTFKDNKKMISDGAEYAEIIYDNKKDVESLNMFCSFLVKNNQVDKAIKVVNDAKEVAEKAGEDLSGYDGLLNYLQSKKT